MFNDSLYEIPDHIQTRWATAENPSGDKGGACRGNDGRKRRASIQIRAGESATLLDVSGTSGTVRRIWITTQISPKMLRSLRLDFFWDGMDKPAVSAPLGDFMCQGLGQMATFHSALFDSPEGRSFNCYIPMPFRKAAKLTVANEADTGISMFYEIDFTVGDPHPDAMTWLHAHWRRENPTTMRKDYTILPPVQGRGRFLGCNIGVIADTKTYFKSWWGEGEMKIYLDGDTTNPTLCGTGTEDYIGTGWCQGKYAGPYQGCPLADGDKYHYSFYRLHIPDPVWFRKDCRVTMQQIGNCNADIICQMHGAGLQLYYGDEPVDMTRASGYGLFERQDDWSSCAWFYLDRPENGLPALAPVAERIAGL